MNMHIDMRYLGMGSVSNHGAIINVCHLGMTGHLVVLSSHYLSPIKINPYCFIWNFVVVRFCV